MKFNFKIQQYQTDAVDAVAKVFNGQGFHDKINYIRDLGNTEQNLSSQVSFDENEIMEDTRTNLLSFLTNNFCKIFKICKAKIILNFLRPS